jgi:hypothetical protein
MEIDSDEGETTVREIHGMDENAGHEGFWTWHPRGRGSQWLNSTFFPAVSEAF